MEKKTDNVSKEKELVDILNSPDAVQKGDLAEVAKEFSDNKPSSSNLTIDEHKLVWRAKAMLARLSPKSLKIIDDYVDGKRSVGGWNTNQKVMAITGVQQQRNGGMFSNMWDKMMTPRQPGGMQ